MKHVFARLCASALLAALLLSTLSLSGCALFDFFKKEQGRAPAATSAPAPVVSLPDETVYLIAYDLGGGVFDGPTWYTESSEDFVIGEPTRAGYTFEGWTVAGRDGMGKRLTVRRGTKGHLSLTAHWSVIEYTLTLDPAGGSVDDVPATYTIESDAITLPRPSRLGYVFVGWSGPGIDGQDKDVAIPHGSTGDRAYVAHWADVPPGLHFSASEESVEIDYAISEGGDVVTLTAPVLSGAFRFVGWTENGREISRSPVLTFEPFGIQVMSAVYEELPVLTYDPAVGGELSVAVSGTPAQLWGGGARYAGAVTDVTLESGRVRFSAEYLASLEPGWYDFCARTGETSEWFRLRVLGAGVRRLEIDYDTDRYPAAVVTFACDCGGAHTCSVDGGAAFVCHSGDVLSGYDKSRSHTVRVTCAATGDYAQVTKAGWTASSRSYYETTFSFGGHVWDMVVEDEEEFAAMMAYLALVRGIIDYHDGRNSAEYRFWAAGEMTAVLYDRDSCSRLYREAFASFSLPMAPRYATSADSQGSCMVSFTYAGVCDVMSPQELSPVEDGQGLLVRGDRAEDFEDFPIDRLTETALVRTVFELELLPWGKKPVFDETPLSQAAEDVYDAARDVLRLYVSSDMNDYEKLAVVYAWLGLNVTYDHYAAASPVAARLRAFTAYGALVDRLAVCDGFGSALRLMCQIEGIEAEEVTGLKEDGVVNSGHAWNKVNIDGVWYGVDATWAGASGRYVTMKYLFLPEDVLVDEGHYECWCEENRIASRSVLRCAVSTFSWYDMASEGLGVDRRVGSKEEMLALVDACMAKGLTMTELICEGDFVSYLQFVTDVKLRGFTYYTIGDGERYILLFED